MAEHQSRSWIWFTLLAVILLCAVTIHRRHLPYSRAEELASDFAYAPVSSTFDNEANHAADADDLQSLNESLIASAVSTGRSLSRIYRAIMRAKVQELEN